MQVEIQSNIAHTVIEGNYVRLVAFFTNNGAPQTGLSPAVEVFDLTTGKEVIIPIAYDEGENPYDQNIMSEVEAEEEIASGFYSYLFPPVGSEHIYNKSHAYSFRCNGGAMLTDIDQYKVGTIDSQYQVRFTESACVNILIGSQKIVQNSKNQEYVRGVEFRQSFQIFDKNGALMDLTDVSELRLTLSNQNSKLDFDAKINSFFPQNEESGKIDGYKNTKIWRDEKHPSVFWLAIDGEDEKFLNTFKENDVVNFTGYFKLGGNEYILGDSKFSFYSFRVVQSAAIYTPRQYGLDKKFMYSV